MESREGRRQLGDERVRGRERPVDAALGEVEGQGDLGAEGSKRELTGSAGGDRLGLRPSSRRLEHFGLDGREAGLRAMDGLEHLDQAEHGIDGASTAAHVDERVDRCLENLHAARQTGATDIR